MKTKTLEVRVSPELHDRIKRLADTRGVSVSHLVRGCLLGILQGETYFNDPSNRDFTCPDVVRTLKA